MLAHATPKVSELPSSLQKIVGAFQMVPDPMARYKQLLFYASKLPPMPSEDHIPANKVEGCTSQVWVKPQVRGGRTLTRVCRPCRSVALGNHSAARHGGD